MQLTIFTPRKVEPHDNGPLFVEVHALLAVGRQKPMSAWQPRYTIHDCLLLGFHERISRHPEKPEGWVGIPSYHAHGSFVFNKVKLRFLVLDRFIDHQHYCLSLLLEQVSLLQVWIRPGQSVQRGREAVSIGHSPQHWNSGAVLLLGLSPEISFCA